MTEEPPTVELFTQPDCAPCRQVEHLLRAHDLSFEVRDVTADPEALEEIASRGFMATPVTRIGDQWIAGFRKRELEAALLRARPR